MHGDEHRQGWKGGGGVIAATTNYAMMRLLRSPRQKGARAIGEEGGRTEGAGDDC